MDINNRYDGFEDLADIKKNFDSACDNITDDEILFASYGATCYEGDAIILIQREGKLWTVEGGHCSCHGLEGQWDMIETNKEVLRKRELNLYYHARLMKFLEEFLKD